MWSILLNNSNQMQSTEKIEYFIRPKSICEAWGIHSRAGFKIGIVAEL